MFKQGQEEEEGDAETGGPDGARLEVQGPAPAGTPPEAVFAREPTLGVTRQQSQGGANTAMDFGIPAPALLLVNPMADAAVAEPSVVREMSDSIGKAVAVAIDVTSSETAADVGASARTPQAVTSGVEAGGALADGPVLLPSSWRKKLQTRDVRAALIDELYRAAVATKATGGDSSERRPIRELSNRGKSPLVVGAVPPDDANVDQLSTVRVDGEADADGGPQGAP